MPSVLCDGKGDFWVSLKALNKVGNFSDPFALVFEIVE
jgi:hypothetical protein